MSDRTPNAIWTLLFVLACTVSTGCARFRMRTEMISVETAIDPERAVEWHTRGVHLVKRGKLERAEVAFRNATVADPTYGPPHNNLGLLHYDRHELYLAALEFEQARQLMPERTEPVNNMGLVFEAAGRTDEAIGHYRLAYELEPTNAEYLGNLLRARVSQGEVGQELEDDLRALVFIDSRPEWVAWANDQLAMLPGRAASNAPPNRVEILPSPGYGSIAD